jgi:hypothetical protein
MSDIFISKNQVLKMSTEEKEQSDIGYFKNKRPDQYKFVIKQLLTTNDKYVVIQAPVKSGKRHIVEIYSSLTNGYNINFFISTWNRKSDHEQHERLRNDEFQIKVHTFSTKKAMDMCIKDIQHVLKSIKNSDKIILHIDEMDFGSGEKMLLSKIFEKYKLNDKVRFFLYSATCEIVNPEINKHIDNYKVCKFEPPEVYYGIKNYIDDQKFYEADDFVKFVNGCPVLTDHADELLKDLVSQSKDTSNHRHVGVVRLAGCIPKTGRNKEQIFEAFKDLEKNITEKYLIECTFISHKDDKNCKWNNKDHWEKEITLGKTSLPKLYILNQMAGRSTQWKCHPFLCWYHCKRSKSTPIGTIIQDQERPVYYIDSYNKNNNIKIYGDTNVALYSAGKIPLEECLYRNTRNINQNCKTSGKKTNVNNVGIYINSDYNKIIQFCKDNKLGAITKTGVIHKKHFNVSKDHLNELYRLKKNMTHKGKVYEIKNWDKYKKYENFYISNFRTTRSYFITNTTISAPVVLVSHIKKFIHIGISERQKYRLNIIYDDGETNPDNFLYCLRYFKSCDDDDKKDLVYKNKTMYK